MKFALFLEPALKSFLTGYRRKRSRSYAVVTQASYVLLLVKFHMTAWDSMYILWRGWSSPHGIRWCLHFPEPNKIQWQEMHKDLPNCLCWDRFNYQWQQAWAHVSAYPSACLSSSLPVYLSTCLSKGKVLSCALVCLCLRILFKLLTVVDHNLWVNLIAQSQWS